MDNDERAGGRGSDVLGESGGADLVFDEVLIFASLGKGSLVRAECHEGKGSKRTGSQQRIAAAPSTHGTEDDTRETGQLRSEFRHSELRRWAWRMFKTIVKALCEARGYDEAMNPFIEEGIRRMEEDQGIEWSKERRQVARAAQVALLLGRNSMVRSEEGFGQAMQDNAGGRQPGDWDHYRLTWDGQMILLLAILAKVAEAIDTGIAVRVDYVSGELGSGDQGVGSRRSLVASLHGYVGFMGLMQAGQ